MAGDLKRVAGALGAIYPHSRKANLRPSTMPVIWLGAPAHVARRPDYNGMDVIIVRDGKIAARYVFLDSMPS